MNLYNVLQQIEKTDPEVYERLDGRRGALKKFSGLAGKLALATVPIAFGSLFRKAYGQTPTAVVEVLNFALTLEHLEAEFYTRAVAATGLIPAGAALQAFTTIRDHEVAHVNFLTTAIQGAGGTPVA